MIIVEGCDGSGKTTLVERLSKKYDLPVAKRVKDRDRLREFTIPDTFRAMARAARSTDPAPYIYDRLFFSEMIYSPIIRGEDAQFNIAQIGFVTRFLEAGRFPIILCCPEWEVVERNLKSEGHQLDGVVEKGFEIHQAYFRMFMRVQENYTGMHMIAYDYTNPESEFDVEQGVESFLAEYNARRVDFAPLTASE